MNINAAFEQGVLRIRQPQWYSAACYLRLNGDEKVGLYPWAKLFDRSTQKAIGVGTPQEMLTIMMDREEDVWEAYTGEPDSEDPD